MSRPYNTRFRITRRREGALSHLGESIKNLKTIGTSETDRERIESMIHQKNIESLILKARLHNPINGVLSLPPKMVSTMDFVTGDQSWGRSYEAPFRNMF